MIAIILIDKVLVKLQIRLFERGNICFIFIGKNFKVAKD